MVGAEMIVHGSAKDELLEGTVVFLALLERVAGLCGEDDSVLEDDLALVVDV